MQNQIASNRKRLAVINAETERLVNALGELNKMLHLLPQMSSQTSSRDLITCFLISFR